MEYLINSIYVTFENIVYIVYHQIIAIPMGTESVLLTVPKSDLC